MKKPIFVIPSLLFFTAILYAGIGFDAVVPADTGIEAVNSSMIIGGLIMDISLDETEKSLDSGGIIYDEFFEDALIDFNDRKKEELALLRKKDSRWHLAEYRVKRGDSVSTLSVRSGVSKEVLCRINGINNENELMMGSLINLPSRTGIEHKIRRGETPGGLAKKYKVSVDKIIEHNNIDPLKMSVEKKIFIPGGKKTPVKHLGTQIASPGGAPGGLSIIWPLKGRITSGFGMRRDPFTKKRRFHNGIDISVEPGTPVRAAAEGTVIFSGWKNGYGNMVVLSHHGKYLTVYAHNSQNSVEEKQSVKKGEIIASSGMTGAVTGAHLHFELRKIDHLTPLNPMRFIK